MSLNNYKYLYGPVPSRRLGRSLGIDLVPFKTCAYDCIYCQLGRTTNKTITRCPYVPIDSVLGELKTKLAGGKRPDFITIAGSGEPTLHSEIGELIRLIKKITTIPVAVLTNSSLLFMADVRSALMQADLVIPSLDAGDEMFFRYVNRPHEGISFDEMVNGLIEFTQKFSGEVWLEVLLLFGITGMTNEARKIASYVEKIGAQRTQISTVCRPPAEDYACAVAGRQMEKLALLFPGEVDIICKDGTDSISHASATDVTNSEIMNLLARRPCTFSDVCYGLGFHPHDAAKRLNKLLEEKQITVLRAENDVFYKVQV